MDFEFVERVTQDQLVERTKSSKASKARIRAVTAIPVGAVAFGLWFHSFWAGAAFGMFLEILNDLREGQ